MPIDDLFPVCAFLVSATAAVGKPVTQGVQWSSNGHEAYLAGDESSDEDESDAESAQGEECDSMAESSDDDCGSECEDHESKDAIISRRPATIPVAKEAVKCSQRLAKVSQHANGPADTNNRKLRSQITSTAQSPIEVEEPQPMGVFQGVVMPPGQALIPGYQVMPNPHFTHPGSVMAHSHPNGIYQPPAFYHSVSMNGAAASALAAGRVMHQNHIQAQNGVVANGSTRRAGAALGNGSTRAAANHGRRYAAEDDESESDDEEEDNDDDEDEEDFDEEREGGVKPVKVRRVTVDRSQKCKSGVLVSTRSSLTY